MVGDIIWAVRDSARYFVELAVWLLPLFLIASFLVGIAEAYLPPERLQRLLRNQRGARGNVIAAAIGAVTPFCSCASIPVLAGLLQAGAPLGIALSFLIASPLINEVAIILLGGLFGWRVAAFYVGMTFVTVVAVGLIIDQLDLDAHVKIEQTVPHPAPDGGTPQEQCVDESMAARTHRDHLRTAGRKALTFCIDMAPYLLLGMVLGAALHGFVPTTWIQSILGPQNPAAVPVATVVGAPIYVSISAMLPLASSLADQGIPLGTVLAFVIGGAGVSIPNLIILANFFDRYLLSIYVLVVVAVGVIVGTIFNMFPL
jgi:uncharacterized membrane protein YraQ (UPF0718 family)